MKDKPIVIEQAIYLIQGNDDPRLLARSPGFPDDWLPLAEPLCSGFGKRPAGIACPACLFAQPFGKRQVAVVQVADQGLDNADRPAGLGFRVLILARPDYINLGGDPFVIADQFPVPWAARGALPALLWPAKLPASPTVAHLQEILQRAEEGPNLLGGSQILIDGGRLVFERPAPDSEAIRNLWTLLPMSTRCELWPATFAFSNALGFHAVVTPDAGTDEFAGYIRSEQAGDYPEGRYELNLQIAIESGDQSEVDALLARRSRRETWRLGLYVLATCLVMAGVCNWLMPPPAPARKPHWPAPVKPHPVHHQGGSSGDKGR
jgi:hypothetical protein